MLSKIPVIKRLYPSLRRKWAALAWTGGCRVVRHRGLLLTLHYKNFIDREIAFFGRYEDRQIDRLMQEVRLGGDLFLDIGANFGLYAMLAAQGGYCAEVHAFEPDPRNRAQFMGHLFLNQMTQKIHLHAEAVSDRVGDLAFVLYPEKSTGQTRVAPAGGGQDTVTLKAVTLDSVFPVKGKRIFMKIDVEGHERAALQGGRELLKNNDCFLQVECFPENAAAVEEDMKALGYSPVHRIDHDYYFSKV